MHLYSYSKRPVHLGPYPAERLGRGGGAPDLILALEANIPLTLDNLYVLRHWGELFRGCAGYTDARTAIPQQHDPCLPGRR